MTLPDTAIIYIRAASVSSRSPIARSSSSRGESTPGRRDHGRCRALLDEDESITVSEVAGVTGAATGVMAVEEAGLAAETAGSSRADTAGLAQLDADLAAMVGALELSSDSLDFGRDRLPRRVAHGALHPRSVPPPGGPRGRARAVPRGRADLA